MHIAIAFIIAFIGYQVLVAFNGGPAQGYLFSVIARAFIVALIIAAACACAVAGWDYLFTGVAAIRS